MICTSHLFHLSGDKVHDDDVIVASRRENEVVAVVGEGGDKADVTDARADRHLVRPLHRAWGERREYSVVQ